MDGPAIVEVESNEHNTGVVRPYKLHCFTGSGSTLMDIIRYQEVIDRFAAGRQRRAVPDIRIPYP